MSTPPPPVPIPPPSQDDPKDRSSSDDKGKASIEAEETPSPEEEEVLGPDEEAPSLDDEDDEEETADTEGDGRAPPKDEKKPRRRRSKRKDRRRRKRGKKTSSSEDSDEEKSDKEKPRKKKPSKREKPEGPEGPKKPKSYHKAGPEVQAYMDQLQSEERKLAKRNKYLIGAVVGAVLLLLLTIWGTRRASVGPYAVLENIEIEQNPIDRGRLEVKFEVVKPGKVLFRRISGGIETELVDTYASAGKVERPWSWSYQPGKDIRITIKYRQWLFWKEFTRTFPTTNRVDVVILLDTTRSMGACIEELGEKGFFAFANSLKNQGVNARFALVGFGDTRERGWLDERSFTKDYSRFHDSIKDLTRFDGGDLPDSALDALEESLKLKLDKNSARCFYLVTDAPYHEPTRSGKTAEQFAEELKKRRVLLRVFSKPEYEKDYAKLLGETGRFIPIRSFGQVLREGHILGE